MNGAERREHNAQLERDWNAQQSAPVDSALIAPPLAQDARTRSHLRAERAICQGDWPFVCPYCSETFQTDNGSFPYCGAICAINASSDR